MQATKSFDDRSLRTALGAFATGVTIVTTRGPQNDVGLTANSFSSVSLKPPMVLWSLAKSSPNIDVFRSTRHFSVHILSAEQEYLSTRFATKGIDKFEGVALERGPDDIPMLSECSARFVCRTAFQYEGGDHVIFVGEVTDFMHTKRSPLLFHGGRYGMLFQKEAAHSHPAEASDALRSSDDLHSLISQSWFRIRREAIQEPQRRGWTEGEYAVLRELGREDGLRFSQIEALHRDHGQVLTPEVVRTLAAQGLVRVSEPLDADSEIWMSPAGRQAIIEIVAMLRASEEEALEGFDPSEVQLLKQLLRRVGSELMPRP